MIVIGEKLNSSIKSSYTAMDIEDEAQLIEWMQEQSTADYLDLNTAMFGEKEIEKMLWLIRLVQAHVDCGISIDSPNPDTVLAVANACGDRPVLINSVTADDDFFEIWELAAKKGYGVVCMPTDIDWMRNLRLLVDRAKRHGVLSDRLYLDIALSSVAANDRAGKEALERIRLCKAAFPDCHILCGLSNLSFGMPGRERLNATMLAMATALGLDGVILNLQDPAMQETLAAIRLLLGEDAYGLGYIHRMRED